MIPKPDYNNSILSLSNSIMKYYSAKTHHGTLDVLDKLLERSYKNIILLLMDGMGVNVLEKTLNKDSFLRKNMICEISSVFPCTTTAATVSVLSGKSPNEHGWIGWSCYFSEVDKCIDLFTNMESGTERKASELDLPYKLLGYESIFSQIEQATGNEVATYFISSFSKYYANTMESICAHIKSICKGNERKFIYAYHFEPDLSIHKYGIKDITVKEKMRYFDILIQELSESLQDTLFIITADHGMIDVDMKKIEDFSEIEGLLKRHICVEPRCCSFYVKDEYLSDFPDVFNKYFQDKFILYTHDEFISSGLLGEGRAHGKIDEFVGDYMAVSVSEIAIWYKDEDGTERKFKGAHAGLSNSELIVPFIAKAL